MEDHAVVGDGIAVDVGLDGGVAKGHLEAHLEPGIAGEGCRSDKTEGLIACGPGI